MVRKVAKVPVKYVDVINLRYFYLKLGDSIIWVKPSFIEGGLLSFPLNADIYKVGTKGGKTYYLLSEYYKKEDQLHLFEVKDAKLDVSSAYENKITIEGDMYNYVFIRTKDDYYLKFSSNSTSTYFTPQGEYESSLELPPRSFGVEPDIVDY